MIAEPPPQLQGWRRFRYFFYQGLRRDFIHYILFVVLVMAVAAMIVAITGFNQISAQNEQLKKLIGCQNSYNEINNERTRRLEELSDAEREAGAGADKALSKLVNAMTNGAEREVLTGLVEELDQKLDEQLKAIAVADNERLAHPVPQPPNALCGDVPD